MKSEPDCYGKMFPPLIRLEHDERWLERCSAIRLPARGWSSRDASLPPILMLGAIAWNATTWMAVTGCRREPC